MWKETGSKRDDTIWPRLKLETRTKIFWVSLSRDLPTPLDNLKFLSHLLKLTNRYQDKDTQEGDKSNMSCYYLNEKLVFTPYLPQLHADSTVQLNEPGFQMHWLALWIIKIDCCTLVMVALNLRQVHSQIVTQLTEFGLTGILEAEFESYKHKCKIY